MQAFVSAFGSWLPYLAGALLLAALVLFVVVALLLRRAAKPAETDEDDEDQADAPAAVEADTQGHRLHQVFRAAVRRMDRGRRASAYRYRTPWVVLLGERGSGKSALLAGARAAGLSAEVLPEDGELDGHSCDAAWWLFDTGAVLDVRGRAMGDDDGDRGAELRWRRLLSTLQRFRPDRPADAVVLTLPAGDFVGPNRLEDAALERKAESLYRKLEELQQQLEIRLPIYLVLTQADAIPGFQGFAQEVGIEGRRQVLGWSSPFGGGLPYAPDWIDRAFAHIGRELNSAQVRVMARPEGAGHADDLFRFPNALQELQEPVRRLVDGLMRPSVYHEAFVMRGLYLTGDAGATAPELHALPADRAAAPADAFDDADAPERPGPVRPAFVRDLLAERVFAETGLAQPARHSVLSRNRTQRNLQIASGVAAVFAVVTMVAAGSFLTADGKRMAQALQQVVLSMKDQTRAGAADPSPFEREDAESLLRAFTIADSGALTSALLPAAWLDDLNGDTVRFLSHATQTIVLDATWQELLRETETLIAAGSGPPASVDTFAGIANLPAFDGFQQEVERVRQLERNAERYARIRQQGQGNLTDFRGLVIELFKRPAAVASFENGAIFESALARAEGRPFDLSEDFGESLRSGTRQAGAQFFSQLFGAQPLVAELDAVDDALADLLQGDPDAADTLAAPQAYLDALDDLEAALRDPAYAWLADDDPAFGPAYQAVAEAIADSAILGQGVREAVTQQGTAALEEYRRLLAERYERSPVAPYLKREGTTLLIAQPLEALRGMLDDLVRQTGPVAGGRERLQQDLGPSARVMWNPELLDRAADIFRSYEAFTRTDYDAVPDLVAARVREAAAARAERGMLEMAARAQRVEARNQDLFGPDAEVAIEQEVRNFEQAATGLLRLLTLFGESGFRDARPALRRATVDQTTLLLQAIDELVDSQGDLYGPVAPAGWSGERPLAYALFGVQGPSGLDLYLAQQRGRVRMLAKGYAEPLVRFLDSLAAPPDNAVQEIGRWREAIRAVDGYDAKVPDNDIQRLEDYIRNTMAATTAATCQDVLAAGPPTQIADGLLTGRLADLKLATYQACSGHVDDRLFAVYAQVASAFRPLAGQYPFAPPPADGTVRNALDPAAVRGFFQAYQAAVGPLGEALGTLSPNPATRRGRAIGFLQDLAAMQAVMEPLLDVAGAGTPQALQVQVAFRVNSAREALARNVLEWRLQLGAQTLSSLQQARAATWSAGQPARLTLHWAADAPQQPLATDGLPAVDGARVFYSFAEPWGLLALIQAQRSDPADFTANADLSPSTLRFDIATERRPPTDAQGEGPRPVTSPPQDAARLFMRLQLYPANAEPGKTEPIVVPARFPDRLPDVDTGEQRS